MFVLAIELVLIVTTYIVSSSWLTAGVALIITVTGYVVCSDQDIFSKALGVFYVACIAALIYLFGIYAITIANSIHDGYFIEMKEYLLEVGSILTKGATPPFNITGNGPSDLTIFIFGFAILEALLRVIRLYLKHR